jgi:hypothetical protein
MNALERIASRVTETPSGCLVYKGAKTNGYGRIRHNGRDCYAHRVAYEAAHGPIPQGLHIDHLCRTRACVNPAHLEAVTQLENNRRAALATAVGVYHSPHLSSKNPWRAQIGVDERYIHLGMFPTREAALEARRAAEIEYFGATRRAADADRRAEIESEVAALKAGL